MVDSMIPSFRIMYWKYLAIFDGYINFNENLNFKLKTYYSAKELGYNGIRVEFHNHKTRTKEYVGTYGVDEILKIDFSNYEQNGLSFLEVLINEKTDKQLENPFKKEAEEYVQKKAQDNEKRTAYIDLKVYGVVCLNNGLVFKHHSNAANYAGLKGGNSILKCCKGEQKTSGKHPETGEKLQWVYYKDWSENK